MDRLSAPIYLVVYLLCFSGCTIQRTDRPAPSLAIGDEEVITNAEPSAIRRGLANIRNAVGLGPKDTLEFLDDVPPVEYPWLKSEDVRIYAEKKRIASDLIEPQNGSTDGCHATPFSEILGLQGSPEYATKTTQLSYEDQRKQWQQHLSDAASGGLTGENTISPGIEQQDSLHSYRQFNVNFKVHENFALFDVKILDGAHFQQIQLNSIDARDASLLVNGVATVTSGEFRGRVFRAHPIQLTYYFTKQKSPFREEDSWQCTHLHAAYNPDNVNRRYEAELKDCDAKHRPGRPKWRDCVAAVNRKYDLEFSDESSALAQDADEESTRPRSRSIGW